MNCDRHDCGVQRFGFTLLELTIAIAIGALIVLATRELVERLEVTSRILQRRTRHDLRRATADELLRSVVGQIEAGRDSLGSTDMSFVGTRTQAELTTWCQVPGGWEERCRVELRVVASENVTVLQLTSTTLSTLVLDSLSHAAGLAYLVDAGNGGRWVSRWDVSPYAPLAIGVVSDSDTLILPVGPRE